MINNPNTYNPQHSAPMPPMPPGPMMPPMREELLKFPSWLNKYVGCGVNGSHQMSALIMENI